MNQVKLEIIAEYLYETSHTTRWPETSPGDFDSIGRHGTEYWMEKALDLATKLEESDRVRSQYSKMRPLSEREKLRDEMNSFRKRNEMSQKHFAIFAEVSRGTVQRLEYCENVGDIHVKKVLDFMRTYKESDE